MTADVEYRDIPDFPGYRVGSDGSVWSRWQRRGLGPGKGSTMTLGFNWRHLVSSICRRTGYPRLALGTGESRKQSVFLHQVVAVAFHGPRPAGYQVAHENGVRSDCRPCNLSYKTPSANQMDRVRHGTHGRGERNAMAKLTDDAVRGIRSDFGGGLRNKSALGRKYGVSRSAVYLVLSGRNWSHVPERPGKK